MLEKLSSLSGSSQALQQLQDLRTRRLLQIIAISLLGLLIALLLVNGATKLLLLTGSLALCCAAAAAFYQRSLLAAYLLLWSMVLMLSGLAWVAGGLRDIAVLGYPGVLIYAALFGSSMLFVSLLLFIIAFCALMAWATMQGLLIPHIPVISWNTVVFIGVILLITGFSVYLMTKDLRQLMDSLQRENERVRNSQAEIERLAHHDRLTGLPNRILAEIIYQQLLQHCRSNDLRLAVLFLDLDNFKPVNDSLGHSAGDLVLQQLATRLLSQMPEGAMLCRFGGDEFLALVPTDADDGKLSLLAKAMINQTCSPFLVMQTHIEISGSVGIAVVPRDGVEFNVLSKKADMAMYKAKSDGRNTWRFYDEEIDKANIDKFNLLQQIRLALKEQQFQLYYQPKVNLTTGAITGAEALVRWPQLDGSVISPLEFIPLCEESGLIVELGHWVLQEACRACQRWQQLGYGGITVAVNLSSVQFRDGALEQSVQQALKDAGLPAAALELELTESLLIGEALNIQQQLDQLSSLGLTFAIDDFGTGYSNLGYLRRFNATTLKIDKSFISSLCMSKRDEPLVQAIVQLAKSLGLNTVAEGVEDAQTLQKLQQMGCDEAQGYFWSPPLPEADFLRFLPSV
ncbi:EAL domain-containing protein [Rheinheimera riviphila]|uniref:EAL domain-containing protein n=1 Tax=Rheinheimera riviphila TaxID=1834037 RepID=A0A437QJ25_9GAMM|nr:EAL domain-containing protein [Rheinheimera riviphila]RVU34515.1 EAL domain-containing protein [Rheinheimera riviphila]